MNESLYENVQILVGKRKIFYRYFFVEEKKLGTCIRMYDNLSGGWVLLSFGTEILW